MWAGQDGDNSSLDGEQEEVDYYGDVNCQDDDDFYCDDDQYDADDDYDINAQHEYFRHGYESEHEEDDDNWDGQSEDGDYVNNGQHEDYRHGYETVEEDDDDCDDQSEDEDCNYCSESRHEENNNSDVDEHDEVINYGHVRQTEDSRCCDGGEVDVNMQKSVNLEHIFEKYKDFFVKHLRVEKLVLSGVFQDIIGNKTEKDIFHCISMQKGEAAEIFLNAFLKSSAENKWGCLLNALQSPEHELIRDILDRVAAVDELEELEKAINIFRGALCDHLFASSTTEYMIEAGLLTDVEAQNVRCCETQRGESLANFLLLSYLPRSRNWYSKFLRILWIQGHIGLVRLIDPDMLEKFQRSEDDGQPSEPVSVPQGNEQSCGGDSSNWNILATDSTGKTSNAPGCHGGKCIKCQGDVTTTDNNGDDYDEEILETITKRTKRKILKIGRRRQGVSSLECNVAEKEITGHCKGQETFVKNIPGTVNCKGEGQVPSVESVPTMENSRGKGQETYVKTAPKKENCKGRDSGGYVPKTKHHHRNDAGKQTYVKNVFD